MPFVPHDVFRAPADPSAPIWRYMSFTKLVSMLDRRALFFARGDLLTASDRFEGSTTKVNALVWPEVLRQLGTNEDSVRQLVETRAYFAKALVGQTFLTCWTAVARESVSMWRMYVGDTDGVAIKSSYARLTGSLRYGSQRRQAVHVGLVRYIDYEAEAIPENNILWPWVHKRREFESEHELRAVLLASRWTEDNRIDPRPWPESGRFIKSDLDMLVDEIRVSPASSATFVELVEHVLRRYRLPKPVTQSSLLAEPTYG